MGSEHLQCPQCKGTLFVQVTHLLAGGELDPPVPPAYQCGNCGMRVQYFDGELRPYGGR